MTNSAVAVHGLTKIFSVPFHPTRGVVAVKDLNLGIESGEVYGLLGPNGSGKSTTLKIILGLVSPTRGRTEHFIPVAVSGETPGVVREMTIAGEDGRTLLV